MKQTKVEILRFLSLKLQEKGFELKSRNSTLVRFKKPETAMFININGDIILRSWDNESSL